MFKKKGDLSVIILAAGSGNRLIKELNMPKQFYQIKGNPILFYSMKKFDSLDFVFEIILVIPGLNSRELIRKYYPGMEFIKNIKKLKAICSGGEKRQYSVQNGLNYITRESKFVAIHDAARPLVSIEDIKKTYYYATKYGACIVGASSKNTLKVTDENNFIKYTPERKFINEAYTPQIFTKDIIIKAYNNAYKKNITGTDDSFLVEKINKKIYFYFGSTDNIKITSKIDLYILNKLGDKL